MKTSALKHLTLAAAATFTAANVLAAEGETGSLKLKGFVDAQYKSQKSQDNTTGAVINDGALYIQHTTGPTELFIDLPFAWANTGSNANFSIGLNKPQAYIAHTIGATKLQIGQFDTFCGLELNDSPDIFFTTQGQVFNKMLPLTHTGAMATHTLGQFTLKAIAANSVIGKGDAGAQLKGKGEYGASVGFANENYRATANYLTGRITGSADKLRTFTDLLAGVTFGPIAIDIEYAMEKYGDADSGTGLAVIPVYTITPELSAGIRYESLDKAGNTTAATGFTDKVTQLTAGVQYAMSSALKVKADYTTVSTDVSGTKTDDNLFALSAVYKF
jgi:hypothetical protein